MSLFTTAVECADEAAACGDDHRIVLLCETVALPSSGSAERGGDDDDDG
jgi:hypothetical protein